MPIYEYQCQSCHQQTEALQKISDELLVKCPHCGESALKKKVSAAAFRLKGGGWYETDFKTGNKKNLVGSAEGTGSGEKSTASKSADTPSGANTTEKSKSSDSKSGDSKKTA